MRCEEVEALLNRSLEDGVGLRESAALQEHVARCRGCRDDFKRHVAFIAILDGEPEQPPPQGFSDRVMARIRKEAPARGGFIPSPVQLLFSVVVAAVLGFLVLWTDVADLDGIFSRVYLLNVRSIYEAWSSTGTSWRGAWGSGSALTGLVMLGLLVAVNAYFAIHAVGTGRGGRDGR